jgi:hypothetical protein
VFIADLLSPYDCNKGLFYVGRNFILKIALFLATQSNFEKNLGGE